MPNHIQTSNGDPLPKVNQLSSAANPATGKASPGETQQKAVTASGAGGSILPAVTIRPGDQLPTVIHFTSRRPATTGRL